MIEVLTGGTGGKRKKKGCNRGGMLASGRTLIWIEDSDLLLDFHVLRACVCVFVRVYVFFVVSCISSSFVFLCSARVPSTRITKANMRPNVIVAAV